MKKFPLFLFIFGMRLLSFAQGPIPLDSFYVPGSSWTEVVVTQDYPCSAGNDGTTTGMVYTVVRDSVGGGKTYHMLSGSVAGEYGHYINCDIGTVTDGASAGTAAGPVFARIRTDSGRVYFTLLAQQASGYYDCDTPGKEYLLYDFNLAIGSSFPGSTLGDGITVSNIDSVMLSNGRFVPVYNGALIYGIGFQDGFLNYWHMYTCGPGPDVEAQYMLCYNNPSFNYQFNYPAQTLQGSLQYDCFDMDAEIGYFDSMYTASNNYNNYGNSGYNSYNNSVALLYPNPATDVVNINFYPAITTISIINSMGQTVYENQYSVNYNIELLPVDISAFAAGMYFVRVNGSTVGKFVRQLAHGQ